MKDNSSNNNYILTKSEFLELEKISNNLSWLDTRLDFFSNKIGSTSLCMLIIYFRKKEAKQRQLLSINNKIDKKLKEINSNSLYKINIDDELKEYEIEILKSSIKKDLYYLIYSQCNHIHDIDFVLNKRINNTIKKLKMIKSKLNDIENERTKVIEEEINV